MNRRLGLHILIFALPLLLALTLSMIATSQMLHDPPGQQWLKPVHVHSVAELEALFANLGYNWPLAAGPVVPRMMVRSLPAELDNGLSVARKKALFLRVLLPVVLAENKQIRQQRAWLLQLLADGLPAKDSVGWQHLQQLADEYGVRGNLNKPHIQRRLLERVDEVPVALVLAQAANESAWGTSRFVLQANNLFGHWTYRADKGLVPLQRDKDKTHRVRIFPTLRLSVRSYLHNLNTGRAYQHLRQLRASLREQNLPLDSEHLAAGLVNYSERGEDYVREIRTLIRSNELEHFESMQLRDDAGRLR